METLSEHQAYAAMFAFLDKHYRFTESDDLGALLGSMLLLSDERPLDGAMWGEWLAAIKEAKSGTVKIYTELK